MTHGLPDSLASRAASVIDTIGNAVLIEGIPFGAAGYTVLPGRYPISFLPPLLHEAAHFDTFSSPVGHALAALYLRAWTRSACFLREREQPLDEAGAPGPDLQYEAVVDLVRFRIMTAVLSPLSEGLALFTEFDAVPRRSPVTALATKLAGTHFGGEFGEEDAQRTLGQRASHILGQARTLGLFEARKENLISQPFSVAGGGYVPGYLFVKAMRDRLLARGMGRLADGDLFFHTVKSVVFGDIRLARLLLDPELDLVFSASPEAQGKDTANAALLRLQDRFFALADRVDDAFLDRIEQVIGTRQRWSWDEVQFEADAEELADDMDVLGAEMEALDDMAGDHADIAATCDRVLRNRDLLCVASFEAELDVRPNGRVHVGWRAGEVPTGPFLSLPSLDGATPGLRRGTFEVHLSVSQQELYQAVADEKELIAWFRAGETFTPEQVAEMRDRAPAMRAMHRLRTRMEADIETVCWDAEAYRAVLEHYDRQTEQRTEELYGSFLEAMIGLDHDVEIRPELIREGLLGQAEDADLGPLSAYARLSLVTSGIFFAESWDDACADAGADAKEMRSWADAWEARTGFPLFRRFGRAVSTTL